MGQLLSLPMIVIGVFLLIQANRRAVPSGNLSAVAQ
jgi:prolipoprotein diacylglyceryltransferase